MQVIDVKAVCHFDLWMCRDVKEVMLVYFSGIIFVCIEGDSKKITMLIRYPIHKLYS